MVSEKQKDCGTFWGFVVGTTLIDHITKQEFKNAHAKSQD
jgi:hypothetical protein